MKRLIEHTGVLCFLAGFFYVLGTAGASDFGTLPLGRILYQSAIGLALLGIGALLLHKSENF